MKRLLPLVFLALLIAPLAHAQAGSGDSQPTFGENPPKDYHSSQWFAFELKFGPYSPDIDASAGLNGAHPFADLFNPAHTPARPGGKLLTQVEFDVQLFHKFGSLGIGHSIGFYRRSTHSFQYTTSGGSVPCPMGQLCTTPCTVGVNCVASGDTTTLNILPLSLLAVYRFDVPALRWHVPLVPYLKTGLAYYIWWIDNGSGGTSQATSASGQKLSGYGGTFGWVFEPGVSFLLDILDPAAARTMDSEIGINHSYLFFEMSYADINGFGASNKLTLSDLTWNAGLAFEF